MADIRAWRDIDAAWLTSALRAGGIDCEVAGFSTNPVGTGQLGSCILFDLDYKQAAPDAPASVIGKFPGEGEESRSAGAALGNYVREVKFYQLLQPRARITTPICYFAEVDETTHDFVILMENLAPAEQGDQLDGASLDQTRLAVIEAAKMSAAFWNDETLDTYAWVNESQEAPVVLTQELSSGLWAGFCARYANRMTPLARQIGDGASANIDAYLEYRKGNKSLIHCDYRPDNMMFQTPAGGAPITVLDWQSFAYGPPAADIGYFIAGAIDAETRRANEDELLALYIAELARQNVTGYERAEMLRHYVSGAYGLFFTAFVASMLVSQTDRGDDMFFRMLNGAADLIKDHGADNWFT